MKKRPSHILWQTPADFDRYPWPRKSVPFLAQILVETEAGKELLTLYRGEADAFDFSTIERGAFDPYEVKRWAVITPPYSPD